jgi:hypothetical protein
MASPAEASAEPAAVVTTGMADITGDNVAAAREVAIKTAQRQAVEQVLGALIKSSFSAEQKEVVEQNQSAFSAKVEERIYTKSAGYIEAHKIVSERRQGQTYQVTIEARVRARSLEQELAALDSVLKAAGYPKIMLLVAESYTDEKGTKRWIQKPTSAALIEGALVKKHVEMMASDEAQTLRGNQSAWAALIGNDAKVATLAAQAGADVAIVGTAAATYSGFNELGNNMHYLSALINLRAVRGASGKVLASLEVQGKGVGVSAEQARADAVKRAVPKVADELLESLVGVWKKEAEQGSSYVLVIAKVKHYRRVARPLLKTLKSIPGVTNLKERAYQKRSLEVELKFKGSKDDLLDQIYEVVAAQRKFKNIDRTGGQGNTIVLSL